MLPTILVLVHSAPAPVASLLLLGWARCIYASGPLYPQFSLQEALSPQISLLIASSSSDLYSKWIFLMRTSSSVQWITSTWDFTCYILFSNFFLLSHLQPPLFIYRCLYLSVPQWSPLLECKHEGRYFWLPASVLCVQHQTFIIAANTHLHGAKHLSIYWPLISTTSNAHT